MCFQVRRQEKNVVGHKLTLGSLHQTVPSGKKKREKYGNCPIREIRVKERGGRDKGHSRNRGRGEMEEVI